MSDLIRVLVVDDHPLFRHGVVSSLGMEPGLTVVGEASSGEDALKLARELLPDVVLLDISMPGSGYGRENLYRLSGERNRHTDGFGRQGQAACGVQGRRAGLCP